MSDGHDESAWGFPAFARDFPRHPELDALVGAFSRGDYRSVRERAPKLAASSDDERVRRAARLLRERVEPDPTSRVLFALAAALLVVLTGYWIAHDGPGDAISPRGARPASSRSE